MTDQVDRLNAALSDRYTIEREIGAGGMAVVYLAEDLKHKRKVALKVLRPELGAAIGTERFVREIEIAAKLSHPHILPLYDSGGADGLLYYVMPFVEGESLRERLDRDEKIPVAETVRLTDEIASALSYAHEHGIVHRDVKPENIMISGDRAVVADFGIARAVSVAGGEKLTGTGFAVGTPAYMSPEQAFGDSNIDGRSDVYALGCVVYEMVAGRAPFDAETPQALLAKHAADTVPSMRASDPQIPLFVERAVERTLAKDPADRFQTPKEFVEALTSELIVARVGRRRWPLPGIAAAALGVVLIAAWLLTALLGGPRYERLAVLPPVDLTNDPDQEAFVGGLHNALILELQSAGVPVIARTSVMQFENTQQSIREIASELRLDAVIELSVSRDGDSVTIQIGLVDGTTEEYIADPMERRSDIRNLVRLQRDLTAAIASEIQLALTPGAEAQLATEREVNPDAYEAYLRGQFHWQRLSPGDLGRAMEYYDVALEHDPDFALAYAGITLGWGGMYQMGLVPRSEARPRALAALSRALELDSTAVEVQYAKATVKTWTEWDWPAADSAYRRAIELNPNFPDVRAYYAHFLIYMKRPDEAMEQMERAMQLDPLRPLIQGLNANALLMVDRYDEAIAQAEELLRVVPTYGLAINALREAHDASGRWEQCARDIISRAETRGDTQYADAVRQGLLAGDESLAWLQAAAVLEERGRNPWGIAMLYASGDDIDKTFEWLERCFEDHHPTLPYVTAMPPFDGMRDDPRYESLMRRMGLPH